MPNTVITPHICKPITKGRRAFSMLAPLAGMSGQDTTPYVSEWLAVEPGAYMQLNLSVSKLTGVLLVLLETCRNPETDQMRFLGCFSVMNQPGVTQTGLVSDSFVRVIAMPGGGANQSADWIITGEAFVPVAAMVA